MVGSYTDERVRRVFEYWKILLDKGYFISNPAAYDWHEGVALMVQGKAAMYLMGAFIRESYPRDRWEELDFFRFHIIDPKVPVGEDAPTDGFFVPARARNLQNENGDFDLQVVGPFEGGHQGLELFRRLAAIRHDPDFQGSLSPSAAQGYERQGQKF